MPLKIHWTIPVTSTGQVTILWKIPLTSEAAVGIAQGNKKTPEITKVKFRWSMPLKIHWTIPVKSTWTIPVKFRWNMPPDIDSMLPVKIHWTSGNPLEHTAEK